MIPEQSRVFLQRLSLVAFLWLGIGVFFTRADPVAMNAFFQVYFVTALDLVFLLLMFWKLFFNQTAGRSKTIQSLIFFTFKLVCLGLLAITLKRLRNAPTYALVLGVLFIWVGPVLAGILSRIHKGNQERATRF
jgi:multidrug transporter EmrE-like cation transporter